MPKVRNPDRIKAEEIYLNNKGNIELVKIAKKLKRPPGTIRGWKNKDKWDDKLNGTFQENNEKDTERSKRKKRKKGGQPGNKNAVGHGAPKRNKNAETHGLFTKYLPEETLELIEDIQTISIIDILWDQIMIQYAAIIRSQKIMYVESKNEMIKELKKKKEYDGETASSSELEYEFQFAWDRQAVYLQAQSRAMAELRNMISKYDELCKSDMVTEEQRLRIEKLKVDIDKIKEDKGDKNIKVTIVDDIEGEENES